MLKETVSNSPNIRVQIKTQLSVHQCEFRLPIFLNKFTEPVDMPIEAFNRTWDDITHNRPQSF